MSLALALVVAGCAPKAAPPPKPTNERASPPHAVVVLLAIDGVRARDVFDGLDTARYGARAAAVRLSHLSRLVNHEGGLGRPKKPFRASGPNFVSLPGYLEMLSGRPFSGCSSNECERTKLPTLLDELGGVAPSPGAVAAIASWDRIERAATAYQFGFVSTGNRAGHRHGLLARHPALARILAEGERAQGPGGIRSDAATAELALGYLREVHPQFLFVGLGETDEFAHQGDYRRYYDALVRADEFVGRVLTELETLRNAGLEPTLLVTTDHGRAENFRDHGSRFPESSESFLLVDGADVGSSLEETRPQVLADIARLVRHRIGRTRAHESERNFD